MRRIDTDAAVADLIKMNELSAEDRILWEYALRADVAIGTALASLDVLSRRFPRNPIIGLQRARAMTFASRFDEARRLLDSLEPSFVDHARDQYLVVWIELVGREGDFSLEQELCEQFRAEFPDSCAAAIYLAQSHVHQGRLHAAKDLLRDFVSSHPDSPEAYLELGCVLTTLGDFEKALAAMQSALSLSPQVEEIRRGVKDAECAIDISQGTAVQ